MVTNWIDRLSEFQDIASKTITNQRMVSAVRMGIWLLIEKGAAIKKATSTASKRHGVPGRQVEIEIRKIVPEEFFEERQREAAVKHGGNGGGQGIPLSKELDAKNQKHMMDITLKTTNKR